MNNEPENILQMERSGETAPLSSAAAAATVPASRLFPLDWETQKINLKDGRFSHVVRRPTAEEIYAREDERHREIPIAKDNSMSLPDPTEGEAIDAEYFDKIVQESKGYKGVIPVEHKAAAFQGIYLREIYVDEDVDIFADEVPVTEEIGQGDEPDFVITHVLKQPSESERTRFRRRSAGGKLKPGRRGRQNFVPKSNLKEAVDAYDRWCIRVDGACLKADPSADAAALKNAVDPLIKRMVIETLIQELTGNLLD